MTQDGGVPTTRFEQVTVFESGHIHGFRQSEVTRIHFEVVTKRDKTTSPAAVFVRRGRRKEERMPAQRVVVLEGWGHPAIETDLVEKSPTATVATAKHPIFSPHWDALLDDYLSRLDPAARLVFDGRALALAARTPPSVGTGQIREALSTQATSEPEVFSEGAPTEVLQTRYERDPAARRACIEHYGNSCQVCGVNMKDVYGTWGDGFIHVHHRVPVSAIGEAYVVDPIADLVPVCPNCHAMLHRGPTPLPVEELRETVRGRRRDAAP